MLRGMYTAATAMMAYSRRMDVVTNNLVNVNTVGFRQDTMTTRSFPDVLMSRIKDPSVFQYRQVGPHNFGMHVDQVFTSFTSGELEETGASLDMAIIGDGFFVVEYAPHAIREDEDFENNIPFPERFTRAGNFKIDTDGMLVTTNGHYVMGEQGPIMVGTTEFTVDERGNIYVGDEFIDTLRMVTFEDNTVLRKQGHNLFTIFEIPDPDEPDDPEWNDRGAEPVDVVPNVRQGFLETSNVDEAREIVRMMETHRSYEVNQRMISLFDETLRMSVSDIARF